MKKEDFLKLGLEEELAEKAAQASGEELKGYIPKSRFDEVNGKVKTLETDLKNRDDQLDQINKVDADSLQQTIINLQTENANLKSQHDAELKQVRFDAALELALTNAKAKLPKAVKALLDIDMEKVEINEDGSIVGLSDQIKKLQESEDTKFLFDEDKPSSLQGAKPAEGKDGLPDSPDTSKMTYSELAKFMAEHPDAKI